jgi:hypothetical protein
MYRENQTKAILFPQLRRRLHVFGRINLGGMKDRGSILIHRLGLNWLLLLSVVLSFGSTGCRSFLAEHAMKTYPAKIKPADQLIAANGYQEDFICLKTLGEEVVPLEDRYFPPDKRAAMEKEILQDLGRPGCTHETFVLSLRRYLAAFSNEHARIEYNPQPETFTGLYPFKVHYLSNDLYLSDISRDYDRSLLEQKITAFNGQPVSAVEQKLFSFIGAENVWLRRTGLEPFGYSQPETDRLIGLTSSISNRLKLDFAGHDSVWIAPKWKENVAWQSVPPHPNLLTACAPHQYDNRIFTEQNFAYFQFNACFDKTAILDGLSMVNPWVRPLVRAWLGFEFHQKKPNAVLDGIYDPSRPVLKDYLASSIQDINRQGITNLIIDLRYNGGGETELCKQLLYFLTPRTNLLDSREFEYNPKVLAYYDPEKSREIRLWYLKKFGTEPPSGQLLRTPDQERPFFYDITDRKSPYYIPPDRPVFSGKIIVLANQDTHSAASLLAGLMQDNRLAVIVGTTTADNPTGPTGMTPFKLPHSGILVSLPTEYDERALPSNGDILRPDYWVENSMADSEVGRDAVFEKALDLLHLGGAISVERINGALEFLRSLKQKGRQPGWSKNDKGEIGLETYSKSVTFGLCKEGDTDTYHYTVSQASKNSPWQLQKAWRTNQNDRIVEEYPVP